MIDEAIVAGGKAGWGSDEWARLARDADLMREIRKVMIGEAVITMVEHEIDLDTDPLIPERWTVLKGDHQKGGRIKWDAAKVNLYLSKKQQQGKGVIGNSLYKELSGRSLYNANLLDYLLKNPHLVPDEWKDKYVFFWGTIYRDLGRNPCVRYLYWNRGSWHWDYGRLDVVWRDHCPAAVPT